MRGRLWLAAVRPRRDRHGAEIWVLPKGHVEPGEQDAAAAEREVYEETGIRGRVERKLGDVRYVYTWEGERVFKIVSFFLLRPVEGRLGELPPGMEIEVEEARWLPLDEAPRRLAYTGEREMAERARRTLANEPL
jgi:8-oxo-dGTP pyrophosphatase MutT (NUDIX family)